MNCIHRITNTNADFANALDWEDLGQCIREATDDAMLVATSIPESVRSDVSVTPTDEGNQR